MQQWEYEVVRLDSVEYSGGWLDRYGEEGWELVGIYREGSSPYAVFKRPKED